MTTAATHAQTVREALYKAAQRGVWPVAGELGEAHQALDALEAQAERGGFTLDEMHQVLATRNYDRAYFNGRFLRLYRGTSRKTARDGSRMVGWFWEFGLGSWHLTFGRWSS